MQDRNAHLTDEELVLAADGELSEARAEQISEHLAQCWTCRTRQHELENAVAGFVRLHRDAMDALTPVPEPARRLLQAELARLSLAEPPSRPGWSHLFSGWRLATAGAALLLLCLATLNVYQQRWASSHRPNYVPSRRLTPGAARMIDRAKLCNSDLPKNQVVPAELRRRVFDVYGLSKADPGSYEVDYLITPALGGADDIRNLWPQPYVSTVWNAQVKDALEDRLHDMVCHGQLELSQAQRDISTDWIAAYKKYFGTNQPPASGR